MTNDDELLRDFLVESYENLDQLDRDFVALEADPRALDRIAAIFRTIHTLKGSSGFLDFGRLGALAHGGEGLLSVLREGTLALTPEITSALLAMVDRIREMLRNIEATGREGEGTDVEILARLGEFWEASPHTTSSGARGQPVVMSQLFSSVPAPAAAAPSSVFVPETHRPASSERLRDDPALPPSSSATDTTVRVDVGLLDKLMNLVGELVLARNQILQFGERLEDPAFASATQRVNHITTELQEHVMKTRMQPIGNVWAKLPRVVRDLSLSCGKQVQLEMIGKDTELDRTILEAIKDPLTHIVRNAVDHGIEAPALRAARGKPQNGALVLKAYHEGGHVNIEVSDDGGGLNAEAIRSRAVERKLVTEERAARLSPHELAQLVFLPGFSTAAQLTNVSGRGVGMDVVKTNIEKIGGSVDLSSVPLRGTTLRIKIPLTLAIVPALIVSSGGQRYAIPQVNLLELVRLEGARAHAAIERIHGAPVYRLRGKLLPLVFLSEQLSPGSRWRLDAPSSGSAEEASINIVVLQADDQKLGLVVDDVRDTEEIVVKPLGRELKALNVFQGATIMGDGRVALILDILGLAQHAGAVARDQRKSEQLQSAGPAEQASGDDRQALLVFGVGDGSCMAVPLSEVARIEEFPVERVEHAGSRKVIQYRREILPLIDLHDVLDVPHPESEDGASIRVIVYTEGGRSVGFVVGRIVDVVEDTVHLDRCTARRGVLGATVIQGKVTDMLDVEGVIRAYHPAFFGVRAA